MVYHKFCLHSPDEILQMFCVLKASVFLKVLSPTTLLHLFIF